MMTVHPLGPDGFRYLIESVTRHDEPVERSVPHQRVRGGLAEYYLRTGNPPGEWVGGLAEQFGVAGQVSEEQMARLFGAGRHPVTGEQLGRRYLRFAPVSERVADRERALAPSPERGGAGREWRLDELSDGELAELDGYALAAVRERTGRRPAENSASLAGLDGRARRELIRLQELRRSRERVAGVDLVFSPPKSVQSLWALATITHDQATRDRVENWIRTARDTALRRFEDHVAFGRVGAGGKVWIPVEGIAAAAFLHRSSRAGDPNLHWHVAVASKVQVRDPSGVLRWVSLDTLSLHKAAVSLSETFNGEVERLAMLDGYDFAPRRDQVQHGSRAVRELVGIPEELNRAWSRRRAQVEDNYERLLAAFRTERSRDPLPHEQYRLAQQACLIDRPTKTPGTGPATEVAFWEHIARTTLGEATDLGAVVAAARAARPTTVVTAAEIGPAHRRELTRRTVAAVSDRRPWWTVRHLQAEAERQTRGIPFATVSDRQETIAAVVGAATTPGHYIGPESGNVIRAERRSVVPEPVRLLRPDGESVFREPAGIEYTTSRMLGAEDRVLAAARASDAPRISPTAVEEAIARANSTGPRLAPDQEAAVRALAGSGRWLDLLVGPAGAGKTTTLRALVAAAYADGWSVVGLAPSAKAARILGDSTGIRVVENTRQWELNLANRRITPRPRTLLLIDEASLGHAPTLDAIITAHLRAGGIARLIGDPRQLTSPGAGGLLRWIHQQHGGVELTSLWRFTHEWEAAATLRLRDGDPAAIDEYMAHDRIRHGTAAAMKDQLYRWWLDQRNAGHTALMLVQSTSDVADLSARARRDLVTAGLVEQSGTRLCDGNEAGRGDQLVTRRVDRSLRYNRGADYIRNGDVWTVTTRHGDGSLTVRHADNKGRIRLSASWLGQWAELAYAVTGTRAQGMTVRAAGSLLYPHSTTRNAAVTQLTRGTHENIAFLATDAVLDPDGEPSEEANLDPRAAFVAILDRMEDDTVAHERLAEAFATEQSIRTLSHRYRYVYGILMAARRDTVDVAAALDPDREADLRVLPPRMAAVVRGDPAWPTLAARLQAIAALGRDSAHELAAVATERELVTADSVAQVLHWRLVQRIPDLPPAEHAAAPEIRNERIAVAPWLPVPPRDMPAMYRDLATYLEHTRTAIEARAAQAAAAAGDGTTPWATALGPLPAAGPDRRSWLLLAARIAVYRDVFAVTDTSPLGELPLQASDAQRRTHAQLDAVLAEHHQLPSTGSDGSLRHLLEEREHALAVAHDPWPHTREAVRDGASTPDTATADAAAQQLRSADLLGSPAAPDAASELHRAERAERRAREHAERYAEQANQILAAADAGDGPAVQRLTAERDELAAVVAAIEAAQPIAEAYQATGDNLAALEAQHADLLRQHAANCRAHRPSRTAVHNRLATQMADVQRRIAGLRTYLEPMAAELGASIAIAGPIHEWSTARRRHAEMEDHWADALAAAHAIDRAAVQPWNHRAAALADSAARHRHLAAALRAHAAPHVPRPAVTYGPYEPDLIHEAYAGEPPIPSPQMTATSQPPTRQL